MFQTGFSIFEPYALSRAPGIPDAVIDNEFEPPIRLARNNLAPASSSRAGYSVSEGIFNQGLQNHLRDQDSKGIRLYGLSYFKPCAEAHLFQIKVFVDESYFFLQRNQ